MANPVLSRTFAPAQQQPWQPTPSGVEVPTITADKMTMDGAVSRTLALFGVLVVAATLTWISGAVVLAIPAMFIALGLGLWASFSRKVRPGVMIAYAAFEGIFLAGLTFIFESMFPGIAAQAVLATLATAGTVFVAYRRQVIRVTPRFRQIMMFALIGYMVFALLNVMVSLFTGNSAYNSSFGWLIALVGVGLSAFTLVMDFADIEEGVRAGMPADFEWRAAFGLMVSLVWMYTEILRLLAILRGDD